MLLSVCPPGARPAEEVVLMSSERIGDIWKAMKEVFIVKLSVYSSPRQVT